MSSSLLTPLAMPVIEGIRVPLKFYVVLKEPVPLAGCLCDSEVSYDPYPLKVLFSAELEDLHYGNAPNDPDTLEWLVRKAASVVKREMEAGKGIVVHCVGGIGRTGTVIGCVLRDLGFSADEVIDYLDRINKSRGFRGWPETEWQAEMVRRY